MKVHLQPWYDRWLAVEREAAGIPKNSDPNGGPMLQQVHFVRDDLCSMLWADVAYDKRGEAPPRTCKETCFVVGEHTSKSRRLPVYSLERPDLGVQFVLNYNYHFWQCSVISEKPIAADLRGFEMDFSDSDRKRFETDPWRVGRSWGYCAFQGFPKEVQFGPFSTDPCKFSLTLGTEYSVHTFLFLIMRDIRGVGPWVK